MPGDFREHFDLRRLDDNQMGQIAFVLNSPQYEQSFKPFMEGVLRKLNELWKDRSQQRRDQYPDDFLAGGVIFGEGLLKFFDVLVRETDMERIHASSAVSNDQLYDIHRERGDVKPVVGLDQPATPEMGPADPEEF